MVGNENSVNIAGNILHHIVCPLDRGLSVNHPVVFPYLSRDLQAGQGILSHFQKLGPEDRRKGLNRDQEFLALRRNVCVTMGSMTMGS